MWVCRMKQPWTALIIHKNKDIDIIFPEECQIVGETIEDVLEELLKHPHKSFYEIDHIVLMRYYDGEKKKAKERTERRT